MANGTALFNAIYAQNWVEVVNLVAGVNDPDRGNNQAGLYGRRELGAMMEEFIYMRGWIASVPETLLTQRRTVERTLVQTEAHLYGSSRLGVDKVNRLLLKQTVTEVFVPFSKRWVFLGVTGAPTVQPDDDSLYICIRGKKRYEFSNHLGNVMTTLTDRRVWSTNPDRWVADAVSGQDYDPFGMVRPNRSASDDGYRFGFNGKEDDPEWGMQDYGMRIYDKRVARFLSADPLIIYHQKYVDLTPYQFASNTPIQGIDQDGLEVICVQYGIRVIGICGTVTTSTGIALDISEFYTEGKISVATYDSYSYGFAGGLGVSTGLSVMFIPTGNMSNVAGESFSAGIMGDVGVKTLGATFTFIPETPMPDKWMEQPVTDLPPMLAAAAVDVPGTGPGVGFGFFMEKGVTTLTGEMTFDFNASPKVEQSNIVQHVSKFMNNLSLPDGIKSNASNFVTDTITQLTESSCNVVVIEAEKRCDDSQNNSSDR